MTLIAPTLQAFFSDRLTKQLQASPRTIASYRDTLRLLLGFAHDIDAPPLDRWEGPPRPRAADLTIQAGLRVSELIAINRADITLDTGAHVRVGQRTQAASGPAHQGGQGRPWHVGRRARRPTRRPAVCDAHGAGA